MRGWLEEMRWEIWEFIISLYFVIVHVFISSIPSSDEENGSGAES